MENKIVIASPVIKKNCILYKYEIEGDWKEAFIEKNTFQIEYSEDISDVPEGIAVVPLLANILPIAWVYDAKIEVPVCDEDFYYSIFDFKKGYEDMYPMLSLAGTIKAGTLQKNSSCKKGCEAAFFSGGVDAFNTLVSHAEMHPILLTLWGADVKLDDTIGWANVLSHLKETAEAFDTSYVTVKSEFRTFLREGILSKKVAKSGDGWWHGFQHGIGIICHAAPVAYTKGIEKIYFASSFTVADKGKVTCASDPTIDNYVRFGGTQIFHDGYEFTRQMKVHNIVEFVRKTGVKIPLRVCWESIGGSNCCNCEKCWRTILAIYAEGENPREYGFDYENFGKLCKKIYKNRERLYYHRESRYAPMQAILRQNYTRDNIQPELKWFYDIDIKKLGNAPLWKKIGRKIKYGIRKNCGKNR